MDLRLSERKRRHDLCSNVILGEHLVPSYVIARLGVGSIDWGRTIESVVYESGNGLAKGI